MARAGRKRKQGKRYPCGKIKDSAQVIPFDRGTDRAQARQSRFGPDGHDAIGRAYRAGLLGHGNDAKDRLDTARAMAKAYWQHLPLPGIACALGDRAGPSYHDPERALRREERLNKALGQVRTLSHHHRRAFDQLVIDVNPDAGPPWLDRMLAGTLQAGDATMLKLAIEALDACRTSMIASFRN